MRVSVNAVRDFSMRILRHLGVPDTDADIISDSIVYAHVHGKGTHGIGRLPIYAQKIENGYMNPKTDFKQISDVAAVGLYDAGHGFGQVAAFRGMEKAVEKARQYGIGVAGIRHSNNFGCAGFFTEGAINNHCIGFVFANANPAIAPIGGHTPIFGTNPLAFGFPYSSDGVILDMAVSSAARGKIRQAAKNGEAIPEGWALDKNGDPTTDALEALEGSMIPIGGHKGFGLALVIDVIAGLLTGSAFAGDAKPLNSKTGFSDYGHLLMAVNIGFFMSEVDWSGKTQYLVNRLKACGENIFFPGERRRLGDIEISDTTARELSALAVKLGLEETMRL